MAAWDGVRLACEALSGSFDLLCIHKLAVKDKEKWRDGDTHANKAFVPPSSSTGIELFQSALLRLASTAMVGT